MNKKIISLLLIYFFQSLVTSCDSCNCNTKTFEKTYVGVKLKAWDTSGFQIKEVSETVNKNSFGLTIHFELALNHIANYKQKVELSSFGFTPAYAVSCDCIPDEYINVDPIESVEIIAIDTLSQERLDVTDYFHANGYNETLLTFIELLEDRDYLQDGIQLDLVKHDNIPDTSIFEINITLASGAELIEQTQMITFEGKLSLLSKKTFTP